MSKNVLNDLQMTLHALSSCCKARAYYVKDDPDFSETLIGYLKSIPDDRKVYELKAFIEDMMEESGHCGMCLENFLENIALDTLCARDREELANFVRNRFLVPISQ